MKKREQQPLTVVGCCVVAILAFAVVVYKHHKASVETKSLTDLVSCSAGSDTLTDNWQTFNGSQGYSVQFPSYAGSDPPIETHQDIPESMDGISGGNDTLVLVSDTNHSLDNWSVARHFFNKEPSIDWVKRYFGANKVCSKSGDTYQGYSMVDFFVIEKGDNSTPVFYARYRIIIVNAIVYELKMNSTDSRFNGYDQFVDSFRLAPNV